MCYINIFHLTSLMSPHYFMKHNITNFLYITHYGCTEIDFIEPGVKENGAYYRDNLLAKKLCLLQDIFRISQGGVLSLNLLDVLAHQARDTVAFMERKVPYLWSP